MSDLQMIEAIEQEVASYVGSLGVFIVHKQLKKLHRNKNTISGKEIGEFIRLVIKEVSILTGPKKAREIEKRLLSLSTGSLINSTPPNHNNNGLYFPNGSFNNS